MGIKKQGWGEERIRTQIYKDTYKKNLLSLVWQQNLWSFVCQFPVSRTQSRCPCVEQRREVLKNGWEESWALSTKKFSWMKVEQLWTWVTWREQARRLYLWQAEAVLLLSSTSKGVSPNLSHQWVFKKEGFRGICSHPFGRQGFVSNSGKKPFTDWTNRKQWLLLYYLYLFLARED